ncbi:hypothetical protein SLAVM298S_00516 [Streptomyces lavendulae subsp. lavendulae]
MTGRLQTCSKWNALMKQSRGCPTAKKTQSTSDWAVNGSFAVRGAPSQACESGSWLSKSGG